MIFDTHWDPNPGSDGDACFTETKHTLKGESKDDSNMEVIGRTVGRDSRIPFATGPLSAGDLKVVGSNLLGLLEGTHGTQTVDAEGLPFIDVSGMSTAERHRLSAAV